MHLPIRELDDWSSDNAEAIFASGVLDYREPRPGEPPIDYLELAESCSRKICSVISQRDTKLAEAFGALPVEAELRRALRKLGDLAEIKQLLWQFAAITKRYQLANFMAKLNHEFPIGLPAAAEPQLDLVPA